jgi:hypothetical protein
MEKEVIPPDKYVEKALIDQIFSSTVGSHSLKNKKMPRYFQILKKNLIDSITTKESKQNESNNPNKNHNLQLDLPYHEDSFNKLYNSNSLYAGNHHIRKGLTKRSYTSKFSNLFRYKKNNREILSSFGFRETNKDFTDVTSNINYLLDRNELLLMKEKNFMDGFNFMNKYKLNSNIFNRKISSSRIGMFGKKVDVPLVYDISYTYKNNYSTKSEKNRHEYLLNEINKLKFYLEKNPFDKLTIIKDFFLKFNIKDLDKYSDKKLYDICEFILSKDENDFLNIIKPDINLKKMVYNLLDTPSDKNKKKNSYYKKLNVYNNNIKINKKSRNKIIDNKGIFGVFDTNSRLKFVKNQTRLYLPEKNYSENIDLIINDIGKEVKTIKENLINDKSNNTDMNNMIFITQSKNKTFLPNNINKKYLTLSNLNIKKYTPNRKGTFLFFRKSFTKNIKKEKIDDNKKANFCLKTKKNKIEIKAKDNELINKKKRNSKDLLQRLYYKHHVKKLGLDEVKRNKKLTEFIALNLAKKKSRLKNFEGILNPVKKNFSFNF